MSVMRWQGPVILNVPLVGLESMLIRLVNLHASRVILATMLTELGASTVIFAGLGKCLDEPP